MTTARPAIERISIEPSRRCSKGCAFCYNGSGPDGAGSWTAEDVVAFVADCASNGVRAVSFGGGEPLEWPALFETLDALRGRIFRSLTTNGRQLDEPDVFERVVRALPDKVHVSLHVPERARDVEQVIAWVRSLEEVGLRSGVNVLVRRSQLAATARAAARLREAGISNDRMIFLPLRGVGGADTPTPAEVARVAGARFQSMTCLTGCARSPRFVSIDADRRAAWCSYTTTRAALCAPTYGALQAALDGLGLQPCTTQMPSMRPPRSGALAIVRA